MPRSLHVPTPLGLLHACACVCLVGRGDCHCKDRGRANLACPCPARRSEAVVTYLVFRAQEVGLALRQGSRQAGC